MDCGGRTVTKSRKISVVSPDYQRERGHLAPDHAGRDAPPPLGEMSVVLPDHPCLPSFPWKRESRVEIWGHHTNFVPSCHPPTVARFARVREQRLFPIVNQRQERLELDKTVVTPPQPCRRTTPENRCGIPRLQEEPIESIRKQTSQAVPLWRYTARTDPRPFGRNRPLREPHSVPGKTGVPVISAGLGSQSRAPVVPTPSSPSP